MRTARLVKVHYAGQNATYPAAHEDDCMSRTAAFLRSKREPRDPLTSYCINNERQSPQNHNIALYQQHHFSKNERKKERNSIFGFCSPFPHYRHHHQFFARRFETPTITHPPHHVPSRSPIFQMLDWKEEGIGNMDSSKRATQSPCIRYLITTRANREP